MSRYQKFLELSFEHLYPVVIFQILLQKYLFSIFVYLNIWPVCSKRPKHLLLKFGCIILVTVMYTAILQNKIILSLP